MKQNGFHFPTIHQTTPGWPPLGTETPFPAPRGSLALWYRLTAPPEPPSSANFRRHEAVRRGRLTSLIVFILIVVTLLALPIVLWQKNYPLSMALCLWLVVDIVVLLLNKYGLVLIAGVLTVGTTMIIYALIQLLALKGLGVGDLQNFDLLVQAELLAVSLLPARSVFIVALLNSLFIWADVTFQPHAPDLAKLLTTNHYAVVAGSIFLQVIVAVVAYLWVRSATQAIARADRAEVIAALQRAMAAREHDLVEQSRALDTSIAQIVQTHRLVGAGDFHARVHLPGGDLLAPIADSLNSLLVRFQRLLAESDELVRTKVQAAQVVNALREAMVTSLPLHLPEKGIGTCVDLLILELMAYAQRLYTPQMKPVKGALPRVVEEAIGMEKLQEIAPASLQTSRAYPVLEATDVSKKRDGVQIIDHVSLTVWPGEILGIVGAERSGKTALFDLLCGRDAPSDGIIKILGNDLRLHDKQLQQLLGAVSAPPRDFDPLDNNLTIEAYLDAQAEFLGEAQQQRSERIAAVLTLVGLLQYSNLFVRSLSAEMRCCLAFARALLHDPVLLVVDEPTRGVRGQDRQAIWNLLQSLRDEGRTLVLITSSWEEIKNLCNRTIILEHGKLRQDS